MSPHPSGQSAPGSKTLPVADPDFYLFDTSDGPHLLLTDGSQIFKIGEDVAQQLAAASGRGAEAARALLAAHGLGLRRFIGDEPPYDPPMRALSLAVAARCNLGCAYCYAEGGSLRAGARHVLGGRGGFGAAPVCRRQAGRAGQPCLSRGGTADQSHSDTARHRARRAHRHREKYSDWLLHNHQWHASHNGRCRVLRALRLRGDDQPRRGGCGSQSAASTKGGRGSYERVIANVRPLLARQRQMQVSARVTVTPANLSLRAALNHFIDLGFHSVGFSPMLSAPSGHGQMQAPDLDVLLNEMIDCGREFERRIAAGNLYPFANMTTALAEIHRGTHRPYPCGAGASYFGVSASGGLFACHRFVEDEKAAMGHVNGDIDRARQRHWLAERMVDWQEPCRSCWARYLCGGGCHHEVIHRGRPACDYIRGWLDFALGVYVRLSTGNPDLFKDFRGRASSLKGLAVAPD